MSKLSRDTGTQESSSTRSPQHLEILLMWLSPLSSDCTTQSPQGLVATLHHVYKLSDPAFRRNVPVPSVFVSFVPPPMALEFRLWSPPPDTSLALSACFVFSPRFRAVPNMHTSSVLIFSGSLVPCCCFPRTCILRHGHILAPASGSFAPSLKRLAVS